MIKMLIYFSGRIIDENKKREAFSADSKIKIWLSLAFGMHEY